MITHATPAVTPRVARRALQRLATRVDQHETGVTAATRDEAAFSIGANAAWAVLVDLEAGVASDIDPVGLLAAADRHATRPRFAGWSPSETDLLRIAREVVTALEQAADAADAERERRAELLLDAQEDFAAALRGTLPAQPAISALFVGALDAAGVNIADEDAMRIADRLRGWLAGRGVHLIPEIEA